LGEALAIPFSRFPAGVRRDHLLSGPLLTHGTCCAPLLQTTLLPVSFDTTLSQKIGHSLKCGPASHSQWNIRRDNSFHISFIRDVRDPTCPVAKWSSFLHFQAALLKWKPFSTLATSPIQWSRGVLSRFANSTQGLVHQYFCGPTWKGWERLAHRKSSPPD
jgi:hypothetical protein